MPSEISIQNFVHKLEEGSWKQRILFLLLWVACLGVWTLLIFGQFRGLSHAKAMDQAQIGREIARGHGFSTKMIRPLALWQWDENKGALPQGEVPDTYNAPLNPLLDAGLVFFTKSSWHMTHRDIIYPSDRVIAGASAILFLLSVIVNYFTAKRLFDRRLALLGMGMILICDTFWQFSLSGLPQMLMLLIFSGCTYTMVRALEEREEGRNPLRWLLLAAVGFSLLVLAHGLAFWIFLGALVYVTLAFWKTSRAWWRSPAVPMLVIFLIFCTPWLVRTYQVCGNPLGVGIYSLLHQIRGTESYVMRGSTVDWSGVNPMTFRHKILDQLITQFSNIYGNLGRCLLAPVFFLSLLHLFRNLVTSSFRWGLLTMWLFALGGMAVFGLEDEPVRANDLHVLFVPMFIFYGFAFVLVLWSRLTSDRTNLDLRLIRLTFLTCLFIISGLPFLNHLTSSNGRVQWPPYIPPFIAILNEWTAENEIVASDMPWAVAWYADRESLWLPQTVNAFLQLHDYQQLGKPIVGLYLTPVSGDQQLLSGIVNGEYKEWVPFILRNALAPDFPLRAATALPIDNECVFFADHDRWSGVSQ